VSQKRQRGSDNRSSFDEEQGRGQKNTETGEHTEGRTKRYRVEMSENLSYRVVARQL